MTRNGIRIAYLLCPLSDPLLSRMFWLLCANEASVCGVRFENESNNTIIRLGFSSTVGTSNAKITHVNKVRIKWVCAEHETSVSMVQLNVHLIRNCQCRNCLGSFEDETTTIAAATAAGATTTTSKIKTLSYRQTIASHVVWEILKSTESEAQNVGILATLYDEHSLCKMVIFRRCTLPKLVTGKLHDFLKEWLASVHIFTTVNAPLYTHTKL